MKKKLCLLLSVLLALALCASCAQAGAAAGTPAQEQAGGETSAKKLNVVTTIFPPYDFVREVAGENVDVTMLLPPGSESHSFEPTPQDIIKIQDCDLFIHGGGESDAWAARILDSMDTSHMKILAMVDFVDTVEEEIVEGMQDDEDHDHAHGTEEHTDEEAQRRAKKPMPRAKKPMPRAKKPTRRAKKPMPRAKKPM